MKPNLYLKNISAGCFLAMFLLLSSCSAPTESTQMKTSVLNLPVSINSITDFFPLLLTVDVTTTEESTFQMLFVSECNVPLEYFWQAVGGRYPAIPSPFSKPIYVTTKVDGQDCFPGPSILTSSPATGTHSFFAIKNKVPSGTHKVTVEIKTIYDKAHLNNSTLTVWTGKKTPFR